MSIDNLHLFPQTLEDSPQQQMSLNSDPSSSDYNETFLGDLSDMESWSENEIEVCQALQIPFFPTFFAYIFRCMHE